MATKVLIVDDEQDLVELVRYHATKAGFECVEARDGVTALRLVREARPDLVILDLMLPGFDGLQVCRQLRQNPATAHLPIIMLTARAEEVERVVGLELGADDYVVKPFSPRELMARIRAVLRRTHESATRSLMRIGGVEVDEGRHRVTVAGAVIELTAKEFALLCALMRANGRVLSREQLLDGVWGYAQAAEIESRTVDVHVRRLREKLGPEARRVATVKGVGYRFDADALP